MRVLCLCAMATRGLAQGSRRLAVALCICTAVVASFSIWRACCAGSSALSTAHHVAAGFSHLRLPVLPRQHAAQAVRRNDASQPAATAGPIAGLHVMFAMIGRDVAGELPYVLRNIERLGANMASFAVVLVENDSVDDTIAVFRKWSRACGPYFQGRCSGVLLDLGPGPARQRGKKDLALLAQARNRYLELLVKAEYKHIDYLIALDTDMCVDWDVPRMVTAINNLLPYSGTQWHALYAYGACGWYLPPRRPSNLTAADMAPFKASVIEVPPYTPGALPVYCDLFALRGTHGATHNYQDMMIWIPPGTCDVSAMTPEAAGSVNCSHLGNEPVIKVQAAFGGWGMYRADVLRTLRPGGQQVCKYESSGGSCEHIPLSECLRLQLNATQLIATGLVVEWEGCTAQERNRWQTLRWVKPP